MALGLVWLLLLAGLSRDVRAALPATMPSRPTTVTQQCANGACHPTLINQKVMHGPVAQGKCLDCHRYSNVAEHRFEALAAPKQGCTLCHEMKHKAEVHTPVREGRCTACHDPHGSPYAKILKVDPAKELCQSCHMREDSANKEFVHGPAASGACGSCHESHSAARPQLLKQAPWDLCTSCHKDVVPKPGEAMSIHAPARDNCLACHDPHAAKRKNELKLSAPELCLSCHKNIKESLANSPVVHGNMKQDGSCLNCHVVHFSKLPKLQKEPQPQQCLGCHDKPLQTADGQTLTNMAALLKDNPEQHGPIRLGACTACHQPHASDKAQLLSAAYPPDFYASFKLDLYKLCFTCHSPDLVLKPDATALTGFTDGKKNLHWVHVNQEKGRTCRACHEVHASHQPFHIRDSVPFGPNGWAITIKYTQTPTGGSCAAGCHAERSYDHGERARTIPIAAMLPKGQALMNSETPATAPVPRATTGPVAGMARESFPVPLPPFTPGVFPCTGCHDPAQAVNTQRRVLQKPHAGIQLHHDEEHRWCLDCHNAQNRDVLRSASGEPIPFAESYRLCGQCHGLQYRDWKAGVHGKRTGEWNGRKEYLLCVNCHDPHSPKFKQLSPLPPPLRPNVK